MAKLESSVKIIPISGLRCPAGVFAKFQVLERGSRWSQLTTYPASNQNLPMEFRGLLMEYHVHEDLRESL